jgi:hypothetical protein
VRLALYRDQKIIEKAINVFGERGPTGEVRAFQRMPLQPELALATPDNPLGAARPNLVDPADPARAVYFAPISRYWAPRSRLLRGAKAPPSEGLMELGEAFDWSYFQAAAPDQQVTFLRGDEWLVLDGVHPSLHRLKTQLPSVRVKGRLFAPSPTGAMAVTGALDLVADTLAIDSDRMTCSVVFRGSVPADGAALQSLKVYVALELGGEEARFPNPDTVPPARVGGIATATPQRLGETIPTTPQSAPPAAGSMPFQRRGSGAMPAVRPNVPSVAPADDEDAAIGATEVLRSADVVRAIAARERLREPTRTIHPARLEVPPAAVIRNRPAAVALARDLCDQRRSSGDGGIVADREGRGLPGARTGEQRVRACAHGGRAAQFTQNRLRRQ